MPSVGVGRMGVHLRPHGTNFAAGAIGLQGAAVVSTTFWHGLGFLRRFPWASKSRAKAAASGARRSDGCGPGSGTANSWSRRPKTDLPRLIHGVGLRGLAERCRGPDTTRRRFGTSAGLLEETDRCGQRSGANAPCCACQLCWPPPGFQAARRFRSGTSLWRSGSTNGASDMPRRASRTPPRWLDPRCGPAGRLRPVRPRPMPAIHAPEQPWERVRWLARACRWAAGRHRSRPAGPS